MTIHLHAKTLTAVLREDDYVWIAVFTKAVVGAAVSTKEEHEAVTAAV